MLKGVTNGVAIAVGTGVGVGLIIDGRVYQGAHNAAGEVGYWLLGSLGPIEKPTGFGAPRVHSCRTRYRRAGEKRSGSRCAAGPRG